MKNNNSTEYSVVAHSICELMERASWIRKMFEEGARLKEKYGADQVFDFSLGNPVLPPPPKVHQAIRDLLDENPVGLHRYMPNAGHPGTRNFLAQQLVTETGLSFQKENVVMSVGAGGGLNVIFKALLNPGDEVLVFAPYFVEYGTYVSNYQGVLKVVPTTSEFQPDLERIANAITARTKAVLINSPNNPTGVVYSQKTLNDLGALIREQEKNYGHPILLISDEPYRHLLFDGVHNGNVFLAHNSTIQVTSHSKDLGLAGERIGYIAVHPDLVQCQNIQNALTLATRILGFVNAPALMQHILPRIGSARIDVQIYQDLRDQMLAMLLKLGFEVVHPQGAFYMFPRSPISDDVEFVRKAQEYRLLLVPGSGFGCPGYFRIAYCCDAQTITNSYAQFELLLNDIKK